MAEELQQLELTHKMQRLAEELATDININDRYFVRSYGAEAQAGIAKLPNLILAKNTLEELNVSKHSLAEAMNKIRDYDAKLEELANSENEKKSFFFRMFSPKEDKEKKLIQLYNQIENELQQLSKKLIKQRGILAKICEEFDSFFVINEKQYKNLQIHIYAGELALESAKIDLVDMKYNIGSTSLRISDLEDSIKRWEDRLYDLKTTQSTSCVTAMELKLVQTNCETMANSIQKTIETAIPMWQTQMAIAIGIKVVSNQVATGKIDIEKARTISSSMIKLLDENAKILYGGNIENEEKLNKLENL